MSGVPVCPQGALGGLSPRAPQHRLEHGPQGLEDGRELSLIEMTGHGVETRTDWIPAAGITDLGLAVEEPLCMTKPFWSKKRMQRSSSLMIFLVSVEPRGSGS